MDLGALVAAHHASVARGGPESVRTSSYTARHQQPGARVRGGTRWSDQSVGATCCAGPCSAGRRSRWPRSSPRARGAPGRRRRRDPRARDLPVRAFRRATSGGWSENFAPVSARRSRRSTSRWSTGAIPTALTGLYVRNGSNPQSGDSSHWFFGDGMVHGVRLERGKAALVPQPLRAHRAVRRQAGFGEGAPGGASNQANVSADLARRQAAHERRGRPAVRAVAGRPRRRSALRLRGQLTTAFTAHPKIDPATGRLHFFGYGFTPPYLTYHVAEPDGRLVSQHRGAGRGVDDDPRLHDHRDATWCSGSCRCCSTSTPPTKMDREPGLRRLPVPVGTRATARGIGVMPLGGPGSAIQWFEIDPCYVFHGVNAYRDGDDVVLDVCRLSSMFAPNQQLGGDLTLRRWTVDTVAETVNDDDRRGGRPGRAAVARPAAGRARAPLRLLRPDPRQPGHRRVRRAHQARLPDRPGRGLGPGTVASTRASGCSSPTGTTRRGRRVPAHLRARRRRRDRASSSSSTRPTCRAGRSPRVAVPQRVPYGFHATWVTA